MPESGVNTQLTIERRLASLRRRLVRESTLAIEMLERALDALQRMDVELAREVRRSDDRVDREEVAIEAECFEILTLFHPFAKDFRRLTFVLKVNADIERAADHAASIAKIVVRLNESLPPGAVHPALPTALVDLCQRVPLTCHRLLRAVLDENESAAREIMLQDDSIDKLERQLFREVLDYMKTGEQYHAAGLLLSRCGRELERVGDLMCNVAEDVVYLSSGQIIRHEGKQRPANP